MSEEPYLPEKALESMKIEALGEEISEKFGFSLPFKMDEKNIQSLQTLIDEEERSTAWEEIRRPKEKIERKYGSSTLLDKIEREAEKALASEDVEAFQEAGEKLQKYRWHLRHIYKGRSIFPNVEIRGIENLSEADSVDEVVEFSREFDRLTHHFKVDRQAQKMVIDLSSDEGGLNYGYDFIGDTPDPTSPATEEINGDAFRYWRRNKY